MAPYTSTELYDALLAHAKTSLPDRETADRLANGLRDFSGLVAEKANVEAAAAAAGPTLLETASTTSAVGETVARAPVLRECSLSHRSASSESDFAPLARELTPSVSLHRSQ